MERPPVHGEATLTLSITVQGSKGPIVTHYRATFLPSHPEVGAPAWRLVKLKDGSPSDTRYDVLLTNRGATCDCPDWIYAREHKDPGGCKHVKALTAVGILRRGQ